METKVLIVDDDEITQKLIGMFLTQINCLFDCALTGNQAIKLYNDNPYDLILMDIGLPDLSGISVSKIMRQSQPHKKYTPIVALTAHGDDSYKEAAFSAGMDKFLKKPIDSKAIDNLINKLKLETCSSNYVNG